MNSIVSRDRHGENGAVWGQRFAMCKLSSVNLGSWL